MIPTYVVPYLLLPEIMKYNLLYCRDVFPWDQFQKLWGSLVWMVEMTSHSVKELHEGSNQCLEHKSETREEAARF